MASLALDELAIALTEWALNFGLNAGLDLFQLVNQSFWSFALLQSQSLGALLQN